MLFGNVILCASLTHRRALTALHVELTDRIIPSLGIGRSGPGKPLEVTDAELVCLAGISDHSFPRTTGTPQAAVDRIFE